MFTNTLPNSLTALEYLTKLVLSLNQVMSDAEVPEGSPGPRSPARSRSGSPKSREADDMAETQIEAEAETQVSLRPHIMSQNMSNLF